MVITVVSNVDNEFGSTLQKMNRKFQTLLDHDHDHGLDQDQDKYQDQDQEQG